MISVCWTWYWCKVLMNSWGICQLIRFCRKWKRRGGGSKNLRWLYLYWLWVSRVSTFRVRFLSTRPHKKKFYCHRSNTNHSLAIGSLSVDEEEAAAHNASRVLLRRINLWFPIIKPNFWVGTQIWEGKGKFFEGGDQLLLQLLGKFVNCLCMSTPRWAAAATVGCRAVKWVSLWRGGLTSWSQIGAKIQESSSNKWQRRMSLFYLLASSNQELHSVATPANCKSNLTKSCFSKARSNSSISSSNVLIPQFPGPPDFSSVGLWAQRRRNKRRATHECFSTQ